MHRVFGRIQRTSIWFDSKFTAAGRLLILGLVISTIYSLDPSQTSAYQLAASIAAALLVAVLISFKRPRDLSIQRIIPSFLTAGETGSYVIQLENKTPSSINSVSLRERLTTGRSTSVYFTSSENLQSIGWLERKMGFLPWLNQQRYLFGAKLASSPVQNVPANSSTSFTQPVTPLRRGILYLGGTDIRQTEMLGLARNIKHHPEPDKITVLPPRIQLPKVAWQSQRLFHRGGVSVASTVGDSQEFIGLRDYRPGDPLRQIHWRSFAKLGRPVVREFQDEYFDHHALVLDRCIEAGQEKTFEVATSVAVSFVQTRQPNDSLLDLVLVGDFSWRATAGRGTNDKARLLEHLAVIFPAIDKDGVRNDATKFDQQIKKLLNCNSVVFITCKWDAHCRNNIAQLRRSGINVLGLCIANEQNSFDDHYEIDAASVSQQLPALLESIAHGSK